MATETIERRNAGSLADKGWYLDPFTTWAIEEDDEGERVLTARPKGER